MYSIAFTCYAVFGHCPIFLSLPVSDMGRLLKCYIFNQKALKSIKNSTFFLCSKPVQVLQYNHNMYSYSVTPHSNVAVLQNGPNGVILSVFISSETHIDVVLGPVHAANAHMQTTQAALVHVTGDGAAEAHVAEQTIAT